MDKKISLWEDSPDEIIMPIMSCLLVLLGGWMVAWSDLPYWGEHTDYRKFLEGGCFFCSVVCMCFWQQSHWKRTYYASQEHRDRAMQLGFLSLTKAIVFWSLSLLILGVGLLDEQWHPTGLFSPTTIAYMYRIGEMCIFAGLAGLASSIVCKIAPLEPPLVEK